MTNPRRVIVAGESPALELCAEALAALGNDVQTASLARDEAERFDISSLADVPPAQWFAFAAVGSELLNLRRLGLMSQLRGAGYRLVSVVSKTATVSPTFVPGENVFVGSGAVHESRVATRHNTHIAAGAVVGVGTTLGHSVWIGPRAVIGAGVSIGDGTIIAPGAIIADEVCIGRQCDLGIARTYTGNIPDRTFFSPVFDAAVRMYSPQAS